MAATSLSGWNLVNNEYRGVHVRFQPLNRVPQPPIDFLEKAWVRLRAFVVMAYARHPLPRGESHEQLYRLVQTVCDLGSGYLLAERLRYECESQLTTKLTQSPLVCEYANATIDTALLTQIHIAWLDHSHALGSISIVFAHLDVAFTAIERTHWNKGLRLFHSRLEALPEICGGLVEGVVSLANFERRSSIFPEKGLLRGLVAMASQLGLAELEDALVKSAQLFYRAEADELLPSLSPGEYLEHCERRLLEEKSSCVASLGPTTSDRLVAQASEELLKVRAESILNKAFLVFLMDYQVHNLRRLYNLLGQVGETGRVRCVWTQAIKDVGSSIMQRNVGVVPDLLDLLGRVREIHACAFDHSSDFGIGIKEAFEYILNSSCQALAASLLARYFDDLLRGVDPASAETPPLVDSVGRSNFSAPTLEVSVERALALFRHLFSKDLFEAYYRRDLAERLLQQSSISSDVEMLIIQRLRDECGHGFTSNVEGMVRDMDVSTDILVDFFASSETNVTDASASVSFFVNVLATGLWPTVTPTPEPIYPELPNRLQGAFAGFYKARFRGRSLRWSAALGHCTLRAHYPSARKEFVMSVLQALVCLLFCTATSLTYLEISELTQIAEPDLQKTLQSLSLHKHCQLLIRSSTTQEMSVDDVFHVNVEFGHKFHTIIVPQISQFKGRSNRHDLEIEQRVAADRLHEVDAALVRALKATKKVSHSELVTAVVARCKFHITSADVEKRIESLIAREFLERDKEDQAIYLYLA